jgi:hypothetical protein
MTNEFIPDPQALALKELGFDEPCFGEYYYGKLKYDEVSNGQTAHNDLALAPTYSQAFRWFREKYGLYHRIEVLKEDNGDIVFDFVISQDSDDTEEYYNEGYLTYKEAELACLKKLIEISTKTAKPNPHQMTHSEKWYIPVTEDNHAELNRWRQSVATGHRSHQLRPKLDILLSKHIKDGSYYYASSLEGFKDDPDYNDYQEITLEQFRQITNSQPMKQPKHWCIEATEENFEELYVWWKKNVSGRYYYFEVGCTLMSNHLHDESKYYSGSVAQCLFEYPQFVEITLEQFRQITNSNQTQTTMSKSIRISRELLNEYYNAATTPQKEYLTEHFKLDGSTTVKAIRGLHDMACGGWKPKIKKNHPNCFPEDSKYFDFSEHANKPGQRVVSADVCKSLGLKNDFIQIRNSDNQELDKRSFYLSPTYNWELVKDDNATVLIPTKKS